MMKFTSEGRNGALSRNILSGFTHGNSPAYGLGRPAYLVRGRHAERKFRAKTSFNTSIYLFKHPLLNIYYLLIYLLTQD